jgi:phosphoglucomutase
MNNIDIKIKKWLTEGYDKATKDEILRLQKEDPELLKDAFYKDLEFGTGGLRGVMGVGTNRMNQYTVGAATQGLANYLKSTFKGKHVKVAIAYDSRLQSEYFASVVTDVLSANGVYCFLFESLRSTPELSFTVRYLECHAGIVITASHNPKEYNGYKVYWQDGGQLVPPHDCNIIKEVNKIDSIDKVRWERNDLQVQTIGEEIDEEYLKMLTSLSVNPKTAQQKNNIKIVYTPLHGSGVVMVPKALKAFGFNHVTLVKEQSVPNGNFPTTPYPNPEEKSTLQMALDKAEKIGADLVMATDPDADRVGVAVRNQRGEMVLINGNAMATLLTYYILSHKKKYNELSKSDFVVKTIVTTDLIKDIADDHKVDCIDVLTGFKYIAEKIRENEKKKRFICGGEESYGFLIGDKVRDKDANATCCIFAEMTACMALQNKTVIDLLYDIYHQYGCYREGQVSITKKGQSGAEEIAKMMETYRNTPPDMIANSVVVKMIDYKFQKCFDFVNKKVETLTFPVSDVVQYYTENGTIVTVRPSGTEPKIKFYFSVKENAKDFESMEEIEALLDNRIEKCKLSVLS